MNTFIYGIVEGDKLLYIGKANNPAKRFKEHLIEIKRYGIAQSSVYRKLRGHVNLELILIDEILLNDWQFWEKFYIAYYNSIGANLYNVHPGGDLERYRKYKPTTRLKTKVNLNLYSLDEIKNKIDLYNIPLDKFLKHAKLSKTKFISIIENNSIPTLLIKQNMYFAIRRYELYLK